MNKVQIIGRLTKDPEFRTTTNSQVANFTIAVDRVMTKEADFINCVAWGKLAELARDYRHKGDLTAITGRIQVRSYDDKDGKKRSITEVVVEEMQFLDFHGPKEKEGLEEFEEIDDLKIPF